MVSANVAVFAGKPFRTSLSENDVSRDNVLLATLFGSETLTGRVFGTIVGATLSLVRGVS